MTEETKRPTLDDGSQPPQPPVHRPLAVQLTQRYAEMEPNAIKFYGKGQGSLTIKFMRTLRVSDNGNVSNLPPGFDEFPLYDVSEHPTAFTPADGYFLPMHQREAMWIKFNSSRAFAVKIFVGGVNAVSGDPQHEDKECKLRRLEKYTRGECIQDYVVSPDQPWLDGIADGNGTVRQFVAMPLGSGYSVEAQLTGSDAKGGIQIQVTPQHLPPAVHDASPIELYVRTLTGKVLTLFALPCATVYDLKEKIHEKEGIPPDQQRLILKGEQLMDDLTLHDYGLQKEAVLHLICRLRGGGGGGGGGGVIPLAKILADKEKMGIAAGGHIKQSIVRDETTPGMWDGSRTTTVDLHIVNSTAFKRITGVDPPATPITAKTYAKSGYPYFDIYNEELSEIKGDFKGLKSVNQIDKESPHTDTTKAAIQEVEESMTHPVVELDHRGERLTFRHVEELEEQMEEMLKIEDS